MSESLIRKLPAVHSSVYLASAGATPSAVAAGQTVVITNVLNANAAIATLKLDDNSGDAIMKIPASSSVVFETPHRVTSAKKVYSDKADVTIGYYVEG
jgi:hypothetical protein